MASYRDNAAPAPLVLDFRAVPLRSTIGKLVMGALVLGYTGYLELSARSAPRSVPTANLVVGYGILGTVLVSGTWIVWRALAGWTTRLRFRIEGEQLVIEWHRWWRRVRSEVVPRSFIERVFVEEEHGKATTYRLAIATSSGLLTFESKGVTFGSREDYEKQATELTGFLELGAAAGSGNPEQR
jgi:hypothetical protein